MRKNIFAPGFRFQAPRSIFKLVAILFMCCILFFLFFNYAYANEIIILYTGETHAMLYPCNCPKEPDGGIARRATLIKELRRKNPHALLLDSGGFFAAGLMDEYTQNTQLDMERTKINLKAMELMRYDTLAIGDDEFNFGREFLQENIAKVKSAFLSSNIDSDKVLPYLIKEALGVKIGITALTPSLTLAKSGGLKLTEPKTALKLAIEKLHKEGANIIVLLSHLGETDDLRLIEEVGGIDILIVGHSRIVEEPFSKVGGTLILRPSWQGRKLGKVSLTLKDNKIIDYKVEELRLSDKVRDDQDMLSILPRCFSDNNCKQGYAKGICKNSGTLNSSCEFPTEAKVSLSIINSRDCLACDTKETINYLKGQFPGLTVSYLYYPIAKADKLVKDLGIKVLPAYLLGREIEKEKAFDNLKGNLELKGEFYLIKPQSSGFSFFLDREKIKDKLDLFISLYDKDTAQLLEAVKDFNPTIHFLAVEEDGNFSAGSGNLEVEECLRSVCIQKYYPKEFWGYITCRAKSIASSWWEDCLGNLDATRIRSCARGEEGKSLLKENIRLNKELWVMSGPTYFYENKNIFGTQGVPTKNELRKILKK